MTIQVVISKRGVTLDTLNDPEVIPQVGDYYTYGLLKEKLLLLSRHVIPGNSLQPTKIEFEAMQP